MAAVKHYNWLYLSHLLIQRLRFITELCVMTPNISCRSLTQIGLQISRQRTNGGRARAWLYLKRLYFISSIIAYCISPYASFYAGRNCIFCFSRCLREIVINQLFVEREQSTNGSTIATACEKSGQAVSADSLLTLSNLNFAWASNAFGDKSLRN